MHIRFRSEYGSTERYAQELARMLGTSAHDLDVPVPDDGRPVIYLSYVHGPVIPAAKKASESLHNQGEQNALHRAVAVVTVGMTPIDAAISANRTQSQVPDGVTCFYLSGHLDYARLSHAHRATMTTIVSALKLKPVKSAVDRNLIDTFGLDTDRVDFAELGPIVDWATARVRA